MQSLFKFIMRLLASRKAEMDKRQKELNDEAARCLFESNISARKSELAADALELLQDFASRAAEIEEDAKKGGK